MRVKPNMNTWVKLAYSSSVFLSLQEKHDIPKLGDLPNSKFPILFPFQAITISTTFWQNKWLGREDKKEGSGQF